MDEQERKWVETNNVVCALLRQAHDVLAASSLPMKRKWVELTFEEADRLASKYSSGFRSDHNDALHLVGEVEALLKEKNT